MLSKNEIKAKLRGYLEDAFGPAEAKDIPDDRNIFSGDNPLFDSLDRADFAMWAEFEFKVTIQDQIVTQLTTVDAAVDAIAVALQAQSKFGG